MVSFLATGVFILGNRTVISLHSWNLTSLHDAPVCVIWRDRMAGPGLSLTFLGILAMMVITRRGVQRLYRLSCGHGFPSAAEINESAKYVSHIFPNTSPLLLCLWQATHMRSWFVCKCPPLFCQNRDAVYNNPCFLPVSVCVFHSLKMVLLAGFSDQD